MRVNFFVIATPRLLDGFPTSYVTSFHLPDAQAAFVGRLAQRFPNMTVVTPCQHEGVSSGSHIA